jgi:hypothetical protein
MAGPVLLGTTRLHRPDLPVHQHPQGARMSYIRANKVDRERTNPFSDMTHVENPTLDSELDADGVLNFVLALIEQVNNLSEGEALVVWKEIF